MPEVNVNVLVFGFNFPPLLIVKDVAGENVTLLNKEILPEVLMVTVLFVNVPAPEILDVVSIRKF